ncbi:MAG: hypothetical protein IAF08_02460, partial [Rhizobacter sp.]|nr:hypothetical protein [Chlorobiales bacterium]
MFKKSDLFFVLSGVVAFALANYLLINNRDSESAAFVSLWVPANLIIGLYFRNISTTKKKS